MILKPKDDEFAPFYAGYVGKVPASGPLALLDEQLATFERLRGLPEATVNHRYADGKWTVKEVVGHMADGERVFGYRLLRIARADATPLAGFDENAWAAAAPHAGRSMKDVAEEMIAVRRSTLSLVNSLDEAATARTALANNKLVSARAIVWIIPGHAQHHLDILRERYSIAI
jgi:uncharacterized damage-inducible protein DinB